LGVHVNNARGKTRFRFVRVPGVLAASVALLETVAATR
jgi:hypothetical protein